MQNWLQRYRMLYMARRSSLVSLTMHRHALAAVHSKQTATVLLAT